MYRHDHSLLVEYSSFQEHGCKKVNENEINRTVTKYECTHIFINIINLFTIAEKYY